MITVKMIFAYIVGIAPIILICYFSIPTVIYLYKELWKEKKNKKVLKTP